MTKIPRTRSKRSDSTAAAVKAAQNAALGTLKPPAHVTLTKAATPFWDAIIQNRPRDRWNDADLAHAAVLARAQCDVEKLQREIAKEGNVIRGKENPKHKLVEMLSKRAVMLARMLHVHAEATTGRSQTQGKALELERQARDNTAQHDPLIPRLRSVK